MKTSTLRALTPVLLTFAISSSYAQGPQRTPPPALKKIGILVFPGVQVIDFTGPYEVLSNVFNGQRQRVFEVVTVGLNADPIKTNPGMNGLKITPDFTIDNAPKLDLLIIPGGEIGDVQKNATAIAWIANTAKDAECVMSVCNGAFILAKSGLLKNQSATTFYYFIDELKKDEPTCTPVHDQRFVDNGKVITTAGLSSGIDGALHLVERYTDHYTAQQLALGLEYNWQPELNWSRGNLADRYYISMVGPGFDFPEGKVNAWKTVENSGGIDNWIKRWTFDSPLTREELLKAMEPKFSASWTKGATNGDHSKWSFKGDKGTSWTSDIELKSAGTAWTMTLRIEKDK